MTNSHPPLNEYGANFEMRLDLTDLETARDRNEKALENLRTPTKHPKERARDHSHQSKLRKRGIELAGSPGTGKTRPLSVPPAGFISPAAAANIAGPIGLNRPPNPAVPIRLHLEQCASHPEGPVS